MSLSIKSIPHVRITLLALWFALAVALQSVAQPLHTYLTWQETDTSTTMTVIFHTKKASPSRVHYDTVSRNGDADAYANSAQGASHTIPDLPAERFVHVVNLTGLEPGTTYYFVAGSDSGGYSEEQKFRTIPAGDMPVRFVTGGDMDVFNYAKELLGHAGKTSPHFGLIGGDIAYVNGRVQGYKKWDRWFDNWEENMVTPEGHMIPMVLAIGNHEVNGAYNQPKTNAPFYYGYFAQDPEPYFARTFGGNTVILTLDTGHTVAHDGVQKEWLDATLAKYQDKRWKFACYHIPLYPSHRAYDGVPSRLGREHWGPLFDKYGLTAGFENHDHTHKRSKLLKDNEVHPDGVLYIGDGCFGVSPRDVDEERRWYNEAASSTPHFWLVDVTRDKVAYYAVDQTGNVFDKTESAR